MANCHEPLRVILEVESRIKEKNWWGKGKSFEICTLYQFSDLSHHHSFMVSSKAPTTCFIPIEDLPVSLW